MSKQFDSIPPIPKPFEREPLNDFPVGHRNWEHCGSQSPDDPPKETGLSKSGASARVLSGTLTVADAEAGPTGTEVTDAIEAVYTAATTTPLNHDLVVLTGTYNLAFAIRSTGGAGPSPLSVSFSVTVDGDPTTFYAIGWSLDLFGRRTIELCDHDDPEADPVPGKIMFKPD